MTQEKPKIRLFVPQDFSAGGTLELNVNQAHYLAHVMRADVGEGIAVFNGTHGEWLAGVETLGKKRVTVELKKQIKKQSAAPDIWLVFAPIKNKTEFVAEKATELGVSKILPVVTRHSVVKSINREKLEANIIEAAEQCGRLDIPALENVQELPHLLAKWPENRTLFYADESGGGVPFRELLPKFSAGSCAVLVGPEGGFSKEEQRLLTSKSFVAPFTMGPRILRADTASIAALACVQAWLGDWHEKPNFEVSA